MVDLCRQVVRSIFKCCITCKLCFPAHIYRCDYFKFITGLSRKVTVTHTEFLVSPVYKILNHERH